MKILSSTQIREWDQFTILHEPITSIDLMERAAQSCTDWLINHFNPDQKFIIFCGPGNNGGDGFAVARQLHVAGFAVAVYQLFNGNNYSSDNAINLKRLEDYNISCGLLRSKDDFPKISCGEIVIDALFGTGLSRPLEGLAAELAWYINESLQKVIAIDIPSGLLTDQPTSPKNVVKATYTLSFQLPKLCFLIPENEPEVGEWIILDIGLHKDYYSSAPAHSSLTEKADIKKLLRRRSRFGHKGSFGHAGLIAGSYGMLGAAMLSAKACLRSGVGKLTVFCSSDSYPVLQGVIPEAVFAIRDSFFYSEIINNQYNAIGVGPGIGIGEAQKSALSQLFEKKTPLVIDADALNNLADTPSLLKKIPPGSIITPHVREFERLFGKCQDGYDRISAALTQAEKLGIFIIVKGHFSFLAAPDGNLYFNGTGNAGMATAGSGDVLTGIITGLKAQGYSPRESCLLGMWLHGAAGDIAAMELSEEGMIAGDIVHYLPQSFRNLK